MSIATDLQTLINVDTTTATNAVVLAIKSISAYLKRTIAEGESDEGDQAILLYARNIIVGKRQSRDKNNIITNYLTPEIESLISIEQSDTRIYVNSTAPTVNMWGVDQ